MRLKHQHRSADLPSLRGTEPDQGQKCGTGPDQGQSKSGDNRGGNFQSRRGHHYRLVSPICPACPPPVPHKQENLADLADKYANMTEQELIKSLPGDYKAALVNLEEGNRRSVAISIRTRAEAVDATRPENTRYYGCHHQKRGAPVPILTGKRIPRKQTVRSRNSKVR